MDQQPNVKTMNSKYLNVYSRLQHYTLLNFDSVTIIIAHLVKNPYFYVCVEVIAPHVSEYIK